VQQQQPTILEPLFELFFPPPLVTASSHFVCARLCYQRAVDFARRSLQRHADAKRTCEELTREALRRETLDNVTVVIISFHEVSARKILRESQLR
jgi:hypothetical protein